MRPDISQRARKERSLDERVLSYLEQNGATSVQRLYDALVVTDPSINKLELANTAWRLSETDKASLNDVSPDNASVLQYLSLWDTHLGLYGFMLIALIAVFVIYLTPAELPWIAVRWVLGTLLVAFIPGYMTIEALFPRIRIDPFERLGLSVGLSLVLAMFVGFALNFSPWEITLDPIVVALTVLTIGVALVALARGYLGQ